MARRPSLSTTLQAIGCVAVVAAAGAVVIPSLAGGSPSLPTLAAADTAPDGRAVVPAVPARTGGTRTIRAAEVLHLTGVATSGWNIPRDASVRAEVVGAPPGAIRLMVQRAPQRYVAADARPLTASDLVDEVPLALDATSSATSRTNWNGTATLRIAATSDAGTTEATLPLQVIPAQSQTSVP